MWRWLALIWAVVSVGTVLWFVRLGRLRIKYAFPTMALGLLSGPWRPLRRWPSRPPGASTWKPPWRW